MESSESILFTFFFEVLGTLETTFLGYNIMHGTRYSELSNKFNRKSEQFYKQTGF